MSHLRLGAIAHATDKVFLDLPGEGAQITVQAVYGIDANHRFYVTGRGWYHDRPEDITDLTAPDIGDMGVADVLPTTFPWLDALANFSGRDALSGIPHDVHTRSWATIFDEYIAGFSRDITYDDRVDPLTPYEHLAAYLQCPPQLLEEYIPHPDTTEPRNVVEGITEVINRLEPAWRQHAASLVKLYQL